MPPALPLQLTSVWAAHACAQTPEHQALVSEQHRVLREQLARQPLSPGARQLQRELDSLPLCSPAQPPPGSAGDALSLLAQLPQLPQLSDLGGSKLGQVQQQLEEGEVEGRPGQQSLWGAGAAPPEPPASFMQQEQPAHGGASPEHLSAAQRLFWNAAPPLGCARATDGGPVPAQPCITAGHSVKVPGTPSLGPSLGL